MGDPTNPVLTENRREGGFVVCDPSDGMFTREQGLLAAGAGVCGTGLVCAALLFAGAAVATPLGVNVGNGGFGAIVVGGAAREGDYRLVVIEPAANSGVFTIEDPAGVTIGHGTIGTAFSAAGLSFTLSDGATDFAAGDCFVISVTGAVKYVPYDPTSTSGAQRAAAILWSSVRDATTADKRAVFNVRGPLKVQTAELDWGPGVTTLSQRRTALAQLATRGILSV